MRSAYGKPSCGIPYTIKENFLEDVLTITAVELDVSIYPISNFDLTRILLTNLYQVGQPYFTFKYGDGKYSINNNHCGCSDMKEKGLSAGDGCKCAFPINGTSHNTRSVKFKL